METVRGSWAELVSAALIGIDRRPFVPDAAIPVGTDPAQALLQQAMLVAIPALTGAQPARYEGSLPEPAPADDRPLIPRAAQLRLRAVLDVYPDLLGEWLAAVRASGSRLPSADMPRLLDAGRRDVSVRGILAEVLGARGHWLARANPEWRYLLREPFGPPRPEDWDGPDPDARTAYANGLYAVDPAAARALLEAAWPTLTAALKLNLLEVLARHASGADLPFLEGLGQDASKQVRREADLIHGRLARREERNPRLSPEEFTVEAERLCAAADISDELHRFATDRAHEPWPLAAARTVLANLVESTRENPLDQGDDRAGNRRARNYSAGRKLVVVLAFSSPPELRTDVERVVLARAADSAADDPLQPNFDSLLTVLGFRADMHAELTASADAAPGQE